MYFHICIYTLVLLLWLSTQPAGSHSDLWKSAACHNTCRGWIERGEIHGDPRDPGWNQPSWHLQGFQESYQSPGFALGLLYVCVCWDFWGVSFVFFFLGYWGVSFFCCFFLFERTFEARSFGLYLSDIIFPVGKNSWENPQILDQRFKPLHGITCFHHAWRTAGSNTQIHKICVNLSTRNNATL